MAVGGAGVSDGWSGSSGVGTQQCARWGRRSHLCDPGARGNLFVGGIKASCTLINLLGLFNIEETPVPVHVGGWKGVQKFIRRRQISHKEVVNNFHL